MANMKIAVINATSSNAVLTDAEAQAAVLALGTAEAGHQRFLPRVG